MKFPGWSCNWGRPGGLRPPRAMARRLWPDVHAIIGEVRRHRLDHEVDEGDRGIEEEFLIRIAPDRCLHPMRLRPGPQILEVRRGRHTEERHLRAAFVRISPRSIAATELQVDIGPRLA